MEYNMELYFPAEITASIWFIHYVSDSFTMFRPYFLWVNSAVRMIVSDGQSAAFECSFKVVHLQDKWNICSCILIAWSSIKFPWAGLNKSRLTANCAHTACTNDLVSHCNDHCSSALDATAPLKTRSANKVNPSSWLNGTTLTHKKRRQKSLIQLEIHPPVDIFWYYERQMR